MKKPIIDVLAFFRGGKIEPIKFIHGAGVYDVEKLSGYSVNKDIRAVTITVETTNGYLGVIQYSIPEKAFRLMMLEKLNGGK